MEGFLQIKYKKDNFKIIVFAEGAKSLEWTGFERCLELEALAKTAALGLGRQMAWQNVAGRKRIYILAHVPGL